MTCDSLKFTNLIYTTTSRWANYNPPTKIEVGDYGTIKKETSEFKREGNIFHAEFQALLAKSSKSGINLDLADLTLRPPVREGDNKHSVNSSKVKKTELGVGPSATLAAVVNVTLGTRFEFGNTQGAALVMYKTKYTDLLEDASGRIDKWFKSRPRALRGKCVVTGVVSCGAYWMHLSSKGQGGYSVEVAGEVPIQPGIDVGAHINVTWSSTAITGTTRDGSNPAATYVPLYNLKKFPTYKYLPFRGEVGEDVKVESLEDVRPPDEEDKQPFFALLIGINKYSDPKHNLRGAVSDAEAMQEYLENQLGVPSDQITFLRNSEATKATILHGIAALMNDSRIQRGDPILIYYSGHGAGAPVPAGWGAEGSNVQFLVPHDHNEHNMRLIPDRTLGVLLARLAEQKGNNITVILDSCYSGGGTRTDKDLSRLVRSIDVKEVPSDLDRDIWEHFRPSNSGARAGILASGFATTDFASHVLLVACGPEESTIEEKGKNNSVRGVFTKALLHALESHGAQGLTYRDLLQRLPGLPMQNPQSKGINHDRIMFNAKVTHRQTVAYKIRSSERGYIMDAGAVHGITLGARFAVYQDEDALSARNPLGIVVARQPEGFFTTMDASSEEALFEPGEEGLAVQIHAGHEEDLCIHLAMEEKVDTARAAIARAGNVTIVDDKRQAELGIALENGSVVFEILNPVVAQLGLTRMPFRLEECTPKSLLPIIRAAAHYYWHLRRKNPTGDIQRDVEIDFRQCETDFDDDFKAVLEPYGPNMICNNVIDLPIPEDTATCSMKIKNNGKVPLYLALFYFDNSDLSIGAYKSLISITEKKAADALLPAGESVTYPCEYFLRENQEIDVGFLKLFLSTVPVDFSHIPQKSPFGSHRGEIDEKSYSRDDPRWDTILIPVVQRRVS